MEKAPAMESRKSPPKVIDCAHCPLVRIPISSYRTIKSHSTVAHFAVGRRGVGVIISMIGLLKN